MDLRALTRRVPALSALLLLARRARGTPNRVLRVRSDQTTAPLTTVLRASVVAQPVGVIADDGTLQWRAAPQLQRSPGSSDLLWKELPPPRPLPGRALFAAVDGFSYYHWLTGTLPKLLLAREHGLAWSDLDHVIVNPRHKGATSFQTESLARLGVPLDKVVWIDRGLHLRADELVWVKDPCVDHQTRLEPWARALLRAAFPPSEGRSDAPTRIFVSRARARRRRLREEESLSRLLATYGFVIVELETLAWQQQIDLFARAHTIVGLHGAGLTNVVFAPPGARLVELLPDAWQNPCFQRLAAVCGLSYAAVRARSLPGPRRGFAADAAVSADDVARVLQIPPRH